MKGIENISDQEVLEWIAKEDLTGLGFEHDCLPRWFVDLRKAQLWAEKNGMDLTLDKISSENELVGVVLGSVTFIAKKI